MLSEDKCIEISANVIGGTGPYEKLQETLLPDTFSIYIDTDFPDRSAGYNDIMCMMQSVQERPILRIINMAPEGFVEGVHFIVYISGLKYDPYIKTIMYMTFDEERLYENNDSFCQTGAFLILCAHFKCLDMLDLEIPDKLLSALKSQETWDEPDEVRDAFFKEAQIAIIKWCWSETQLTRSVIDAATGEKISKSDYQKYMNYLNF